ncbi:hypothetical protein MSAN_01370700 [Mycena sanguinolenta]|uniref:Uncharacterized protein n=1 Tax=Mycena sanguinolenta TaxID=230812 RepID=A0A8H6YA05_9AGAR|nr:hypothetical protein MSAN_01370700 [Mycena sanguinolenta]
MSPIQYNIALANCQENMPLRSCNLHRNLHQQLALSYISQSCGYSNIDAGQPTLGDTEHNRCTRKILVVGRRQKRLPPAPHTSTLLYSP